MVFVHVEVLGLIRTGISAASRIRLIGLHSERTVWDTPVHVVATCVLL